MDVRSTERPTITGGDYSERTTTASSGVQRGAIHPADNGTDRPITFPAESSASIW